MVQKYGLLQLQKFVEMLKPSKLKKCMAPSARKIWYSMPVDVFTTFMFRVRYMILTVFTIRNSFNVQYVLNRYLTFLSMSLCYLQQKISVVADAVGRKYSETTPADERSQFGIANAMRMGAKEKANKLYMKMMKLVAMANPANGPEFLEEVIFSRTTNL